MAKRIIAIVIMAVMVLGVFAFTGCDEFNLTEYKADACITVQNHADIKISENDYTEAGLQAIAKVVGDGKDEINAADSKTAVDTVVSTAKEAIDNVLPMENDTGIESSFKTGGSEPSTGVYCAYKTDKTKFKKDAVEVRFYYGRSLAGLPQYPPQTDEYYYSAKIRMESGSGPRIQYDCFYNNILIKEFYDFRTEKYAFRGSIINSFDQFSFSEILIVPQELFVTQTGWVTINVSDGRTWIDGTEDDRGGAAVHFYYKIVGEYVILSATGFEN